MKSIISLMAAAAFGVASFVAPALAADKGTVGIAMPTRPLSAARAGITNDATPKAAAAINEIMDFISLSLVKDSRTKNRPPRNCGRFRIG